jgi:hypothetical protein
MAGQPSDPPSLLVRSIRLFAWLVLAFLFLGYLLIKYVRGVPLPAVLTLALPLLGALLIAFGLVRGLWRWGAGSLGWKADARLVLVGLLLVLVCGTELLRRGVSGKALRQEKEEYRRALEQLRRDLEQFRRDLERWQRGDVCAHFCSCVSARKGYGGALLDETGTIFASSGVGDAAPSPGCLSYPGHPGQWLRRTRAQFIGQTLAGLGAV